MKKCLFFKKEIAKTLTLTLPYWYVWLWFNCPLAGLIVGWLSNLPVRKYHLPWWVCPGNPFHKFIVSPLRKYIVKCSCFLEPRFTKSYFQNFSLEVVCHSGRVDLSMRDYVKQEKTDSSVSLGPPPRPLSAALSGFRVIWEPAPCDPSQPPCFSLSWRSHQAQIWMEEHSFCSPLFSIGGVHVGVFRSWKEKSPIGPVWRGTSWNSARKRGKDEPKVSWWTGGLFSSFWNY